MMTTVNAAMMAHAIRALAMGVVQAANSGHLGMPMGMADVGEVLFSRFVNLNPATDRWPHRDRFVLSAGHGSMLLYAIDHLLSYDDMGLDQIRNVRQMGSHTAGHPEYGHAKRIEVTTGLLGQGLATAVGMAMSERLGHAWFGDLIDHCVYSIAGKGCLMEGISHEAIDVAGHLKLRHLIALRPADVKQIAEVWDIAIGSRTAPVLIALSRQSLRTGRPEAAPENMTAGGTGLRCARDPAGQPRRALLCGRHHAAPHHRRTGRDVSRQSHRPASGRRQ